MDVVLVIAPGCAVQRVQLLGQDALLEPDAGVGVGSRQEEKARKREGELLLHARACTRLPLLEGVVPGPIAGVVAEKAQLVVAVDGVGVGGRKGPAGVAEALPGSPPAVGRARAHLQPDQDHQQSQEQWWQRKILQEIDLSVMCEKKSHRPKWHETCGTVELGRKFWLELQA